MPEPGPGRGHDNERTGGLDKLVLAVAIVGHDQIDIVRIPLDGIVQLGGNDPSAFRRLRNTSAAGWPAYWVMTTAATAKPLPQQVNQAQQPRHR